jgi:predicted transcriptional regulator
MRQPKEKPTVDQIMKLVDQLTPEDRDQILEQLKMSNLRQAIQIGVEQADRGEVVDGEEVFRQMRERNAALRQKCSQ